MTWIQEDTTHNLMTGVDSVCILILASSHLGALHSWVRPPMPRLLKPVLVVLVVLEGPTDLRLRVHDEWPMLHHRLPQRLPSQEDKPQGPRRRVPDAEAVARAEHQRVVARRGGRVLRAAE